MKTMFLALLTLMLFASCSSNEPGDPTSTGQVEYNINGTNYIIEHWPIPVNGEISTASAIHFNSPGSAVGYVFFGNYQTSPATTNQQTKSLNLVVGLDSLVTGTIYSMVDHPYKIQAQIRANNFIYFVDTDTDSTKLSLQVTYHSGGKISGQFSGKFKKSDLSGSSYGITEITAGKFTNLSITY